MQVGFRCSCYCWRERFNPSSHPFALWHYGLWERKRGPTCETLYGGSLSLPWKSNSMVGQWRRVTIWGVCAHFELNDAVLHNVNISKSCGTHFQHVRYSTILHRPRQIYIAQMPICLPHIGNTYRPRLKFRLHWQSHWTHCCTRCPPHERVSFSVL